MRNGRRTFLGLAVSGLGALVGLVWPGKANACRPRIVVCYPAAVPPLYIPMRAPEKLSTAGPVVINFPQPYETVHGDGGFYVWGFVKNATLGSASILLNDGNNGAVQGVAMMNPPTPDGSETTWAFLFNSVPTGSTTYTLAVPYTTPSGSFQQQAPFYCSV
jgi:hypothetical protein